MSDDVLKEFYTGEIERLARLVMGHIDDPEYAQDSLRHDDDVAALRTALGMPAPWMRRE